MGVLSLVPVVQTFIIKLLLNEGGLGGGLMWMEAAASGPEGGGARFLTAAPLKEFWEAT